MKCTHATCTCTCAHTCTCIMRKRICMCVCAHMYVHVGECTSLVPEVQSQDLKSCICTPSPHMTSQIFDLGVMWGLACAHALAGTRSIILLVGFLHHILGMMDMTSSCIISKIGCKSHTIWIIGLMQAYLRGDPSNTPNISSKRMSDGGFYMLKRRFTMLILDYWT